MARDVSVSDDSDTSGNRPETTEIDGNSGLLNRRGYLKLASASALTGAVTTAAAGRASASGYDEITVGAGERRVIRVGSNETLENLLIDCTADEAKVVIAAHGTNWTIRNVGIQGRVGQHDAVFGLSDRRGNTSTMENVYLGDGAVHGHRMGVGIWVAPQHTGHINIDRVNIQEMGDNSFYCSAPMHNGSGGTVDISNCYSRDSWVSHYRLGEGSITNCTAVNTSRYKNGRGVWAWAPGTVHVDNCHLAMGGRHYSVVVGANGRSSAVRMTNTQYDTGFNGGFRRPGGSINMAGGNGTSPRNVVPDGCPTSAVEAASGNSNDASAEPETTRLSNVIVVDGRESDTDTTEYAFTTTGDIEPSTDENATIDAEATVDGNYAEGVVANYLDAFRFDGEIETLTVDGGAAVRVNGVEIDPDDIDDVLENLLLVEGADADVSRYEFVVDGHVESSNAQGATIDDGLEIEDGHVQGTVANWRDAFRFSGSLEQVTVDGPATMSVNGDVIDPADYGADHPHVLEIEGTGEPASFEITVDGDLVYDGDDPAENVTMVSGTTAQSSVTDSTQRFRFSGALTDVSFTDGEANVTLDGEPLEIEDAGDHELLPHAIVIDGTNASGPAVYSFRASGAVVKSDYRNASINEEDIIDGRTVRGAVGNWLDAYWFAGDLEDFKLLGDAAVDVIYNAREQ
ncbi:right-handed parallel beta-helix repeat-containing protein [Natrialbaceae archaeon A-CW2]|uniref:right-handed parallel beta-helix repeat-containing protein n=1 Tax=Natronosalvus amylolyticus TaxID=2961994 RepID=UPI0020C9C3C4|nr:right-handed parallel beta-helix repeat-containing protein [Natronosalvus amylolyticus]